MPDTHFSVQCMPTPTSDPPHLHHWACSPIWGQDESSIWIFNFLFLIVYFTTYTDVPFALDPFLDVFTMILNYVLGCSFSLITFDDSWINFEFVWLLSHLNVLCMFLWNNKLSHSLVMSILHNFITLICSTLHIKIRLNYPASIWGLTYFQIGH